MKSLLVTAIWPVIAIIGFVAATPLVVSSSGILGAKQCTWGPSYWCGNFSNAKQCAAVTHCIQSVWEHQQVPEDNDSVCQICVKMVKEARDQLESNQTQDDLRAVFEGTCALIHVKPIVKECIKIVDDFIPELIEALASQMNPQVVCSVAGLCNSAKIDQMLAEVPKVNEVKPKQLSCNNCFAVVNEMDTKFHKSSKNDIMMNMLQVCRDMGSFTDACSNIILKYFDTIYDHFKDNFNSENVCHVAGVCSDRYHKHKEDKNIEITPLSAIGFVDVGDDVPCDLCKQLVHHLRDILVANTTESEFKYVMEGLCNQTKSFKQECLSIVDQYYDIIYQFLVQNIDEADVCFLAGICPKTALGANKPIPMWPLVQVDVAVHTLETIQKPHRKHLLGANEPKFTAEEIHNMQLPATRLFVPLPQIDSSNPQLCTFCEYFLHFVQETISSPNNEDSIKQAVEHVCEKLPSGVQGQCKAFVDTYGDAFIAIFVQEIDPAQVCPKLSLCPSEDTVEVFQPLPQDKPTCPMCLMAMFELEQKIKNEKTKASIEHALDNLCTHLSENLKPACVQLVDTYYSQIIEMLLADFKPQEICVYLRLCHDKKPDMSIIETVIPTLNKNNHDILTNEIPDNTVNGVPVSVPLGASPVKIIAPVSAVSDKPQCVMCEFVMKQIEDELKNKKNEDEIIHIVNNVCNVMPKNVKHQCRDFVQKYGDMIVQLLIQSLQPEEICSMLGLCNAKFIESKMEIVECSVCQAAVAGLEKLLDNPNIDHKVENLFSKVCHMLPAKRYSKCKEIIEVYGDSFIHLIMTLADKHDVCAKVGLCSAENGYVSIGSEPTRVNKRFSERLLGASKCTWGPSYWCSSMESANECGAAKHCQEKVWLSAGAP